MNSRLKAQLKMAINRLRLVQQKDTALAKDTRRNLAQLLTEGKEQSARIRVENVIRSDINVELLEILELYCELLLARIGLLDTRECDPGLEEAVLTIIYAAPRTEIKELSVIREIFVAKFGKEFAMEVIETPSKHVPEKVLTRLKVDPPSEELVTLYLKEIAKAYRAPFSALTEDDLKDSDDEGDDGGVAETEEPEKELEAPIANPAAAPAAAPAPAPAPPAPKPASARGGPPRKVVDKDLDELQKRFDSLRARR